MASLKAWLVAVLLVFVAGWILLFLAVAARADENTVVSFQDIIQDDLESQSFEVSAPITISIDAIGASKRGSDDLYIYGWIFNNDTREPKWVMDYDNTDRMRHEKELRRFNGEIDLEPGSYTAYYYAGRSYHFGKDFRIGDFDDFIKIIGDAFSDDDDIAEGLEFVITTQDESFQIIKTPKLASGKIVCQLLAHSDNYYESEGFTLAKAIPIRIYAIGEYSKSDKVMVDYAWIVNADTRENVWLMERWNTAPAGGASKNRLFNDEIELPVGNYILYYASDDSHSPDSWNMPPPYDPNSWGVTLMVDDPALAGSIKPYEDTQSTREILAITRLGNNEYETKYFTVKRPVTLNIYAIGEYDEYGDEFADYGWIEDLSNLNRVWEMDRSNTEFAGGSSKNRKFVGNVEFEPGNYVVYYITDDSHSYRHWNASPPADQRHYGITIYGIGADFDKSAVVATNHPKRNGNMLVSITAVRDNKEISRSFTLDCQSRVRIYAIGEGKRHEMYDYAWVENANTGRVVWEMTYRKTKHAGGARKNRMVDDVITLDRGSYTVYYITDDSHSFGDWNDDRPNDPIHWGVTVTLVE